ncbi:MAG: fused MFS/spermidine synthase [Longimicrobiales bacterium]|nr:fused MFS/spermidine synthase [Longimicrobiales bacterium]
MEAWKDRGVRWTVLVLFFLSGACGLVYEVVWMRMLTLVFGATAFATAATLASFFGGLALGSLWLGRVADRSRNPLALYALLEAGVGVFAFLMPVLFAGLTHLYVAVSRGLDLGFYPLTLVRFVLSFLVLLLPTTLMGGTLPVIVRFFAGRREALGWDVGRLYAMNTFGAVVGTMAAGFFLILFLGVKEAAWLAGAVNLAVAGAVFALSRVVEPRREGPAEGAGKAADESAEGLPVAGPEGAYPEIRPGLARLALWAVGLSGVCALALEVLWTRALVYFLDNSTHAFTTMLTAFLLGIALGSAVIARFIDRRRALVAWFGVIEVLIGVCALLAIPVLGSSTPVMARLAEVAPTPMLHWRWTGLRFLTSLTVMLVPTILMGMTVPVVVKIYARQIDRLGTALGHVYSVNTIGGVVGSVLAGFVLIPWLGVRDGIVAVALMSLAIGVALVLFEPALAGRIRAKAVFGLLVLVAGAGALWLARDPMTLSSYKERVDGEEVLFYREGVGSTVKVFRDQQGDKFVSIDGFPVAGTSLGMVDAQQTLGNIPMLLSDVPGARVNLIGFGAGGASWEVLQYDVSAVDCVELVPAVLEAAEWFPEINHGVLEEPRYNAILGDGRNYALVTEETYDVISIDATSPKMAGNGSLYTLEFYESLRERLTEDGLVAQWLPFHLLSDAEMRMTAKTFMAAFPHTTLWLSPIRHHGLLVGTREKLRIDVASVTRKLERDGVRNELEQLGVLDPMDVLSWYVSGEEGLAAYVEGARLNTDNHPYLEFTPAMAYFYTMNYVTRNLLELGKIRESVLPLLINTGATDEETTALAERVGRRFEASQHTLAGDILYYLGRPEEAQAEYSRALAIDPDEKNWAHPIWSGYSPSAPRY